MPIRRNKAVTDDQLRALLDRYVADTTVAAEGVLQFNSHETDELERMLPDAFEADPRFTRRQVRHMLREALRTTRKTGQLNPDRLNKEAKRIASERLAAPLRPFTMWTKFRANQMAFNPGFMVSWNGVEIETVNDLPDALYVESYFLNGHGEICPNQPEFFGHLIARGEARDLDSAADLLIDAMDVFMGLFNLYAVYEGWSIGSNLACEGKLWAGPYHFPFDGETFVGDQQVWFDPFYDEEVWGLSALDMPTVHKVLPRVEKAMATLADSPVRDLLLSVLRPMQDGMIARDEKIALLRYWAALEQLYGDPGSRNRDYKRITQRATFAETDRVVAKLKLAHIASHRHEYVHVGSSDDDLRVMSQHLRRLLSRHVNYILFFAPWVQTHQDWLDFVDLPDEIATLEADKEMIERRLQLIRQHETD